MYTYYNMYWSYYYVNIAFVLTVGMLWVCVFFMSTTNGVGWVLLCEVYSMGVGVLIVMISGGIKNWILVFCVDIVQVSVTLLRAVYVLCFHCVQMFTFTCAFLIPPERFLGVTWRPPAVQPLDPLCVRPRATDN
jgi:hypothetical protein